MTEIAVTTRHRVRWSFTAAAALCLATFTAAFSLGYLAIDPGWVANANTGPGLILQEDSWHSTVLEILKRNVPAVILLYTGAGTLGFGSFLSLFGVAAFVGATFRIGTEAASIAELLGQVGPYFFLEMAACILSAIAGMLPLSSTLLSRTASQDPPQPAVTTYIHALPMSMKIFAGALMLALLAAGIETAVIFNH